MTRHGTIHPRLVDVIVGAVLVVWLVNFAARLVVDNYQSAPQVDAVFMAVVGAALTFNRKGTA